MAYKKWIEWIRTAHYCTAFLSWDFSSRGLESISRVYCRSYVLKFSNWVYIISMAVSMINIRVATPFSRHISMHHFNLHETYLRWYRMQYHVIWYEISTRHINTCYIVMTIGIVLSLVRDCGLRVLFDILMYHYADVIMTILASLITSLTVVYAIVYSDVNQRKHQSSASLAFVREIHRGPVNFPHKWPVTRKMFPFDDVIMIIRRNYFL